MAADRSFNAAEGGAEQVAAEAAVSPTEVAAPLLAGGPLALGGLGRLPPGQRAAMIARLSAAGGNASVSLLIQREQNRIAGGPLLQRADDPPAQSDGRKKIDDAIKDFSQGSFRDVPDWSLAKPEEKFQLLDKATATDLLWVGPRDEAAIERCWASFGNSLQAAVESNPSLWTRSIERGADPENIPATAGKYKSLKSDILDVVTQNLTKNEDRVVAEMGEFGLPPPYELLRAGNPAARGFGSTEKAPMLGGPSVSDKLKDQSRLAKVLIDHKKHLEELSQIHVGIDLRKFNPGDKPVEGQDIVIWDGMTTWDMVNKTWQQVSTEIGLIENAWPALYAADIQGSLEMYASQKFDEKDPFKAAENTNVQLEQMKGTFKMTLGNIKSMRDKIADGDADAIDFTPVHRALWAGQAKGPSGEAWSRALWLPVMNDERQVRDDEVAAVKLAVDVAVMVAMVAGTIGTLGGAALAIGVAGATALSAQNKSDTLTAARGSAVADDSTLVTKAAVTAAQAEAEQAKLEFGVAVVTNVLAAGTALAAQHINPAEMQKAMPKMSAEGGTPETASEIDKLRAKLNAGQPGSDPATAPEPSPDSVTNPGVTKAAPAASAVKSWGTTPINERPKAVADLVNIRLRSDRVAPIEVKATKGSGGYFDKKTWTSFIDGSLFERNEISQSEFDMLVESGYHEARHAKQYWQIARMKAGDKSFKTATEFASTYGYEPGIADEAWKLPMAANDPLYPETTELFESFFGKGANDRAAVVAKINTWNATEGTLREKTAALAEIRNRLGTGTPKEGSTDLFDLRKAEMEVSMAEEANTKAKSAAAGVWDKYLNLPEERQASMAGKQKVEWARFGLARMSELRAAQEELAAAEYRLKVANDKLAAMQPGERASSPADIDRALAEDDVLKAREKVATANNFTRLDTWNLAKTP